LTIAVDVEPSCHALGWNSLPDGAGGPFPARRLNGREGSNYALRPKQLNVRCRF
jgi:hypothetical protein